MEDNERNIISVICTTNAVVSRTNPAIFRTNPVIIRTKTVIVLQIWSYLGHIQSYL